MTDRDPQDFTRQRMLESGLRAFDEAVARRRRRRRGGAVLALAVVAAAVLSLPKSAPVAPVAPAPVAAVDTEPSKGPIAAPDVAMASARRSLPRYVELIADDQRLQVELELASACERVGRTAGRLYVVECSASGGSG